MGACGRVWQVAATGAGLLGRLRCCEATARFQAEAEALARAHAVGAAPDTAAAQVCTAACTRNCMLPWNGTLLHACAGAWFP
jgi:hypothetical protein